MHNDVVEHIFYIWADCARKRRENYTLLYHTRARRCAMEKCGWKKKTGRRTEGKQEKEQKNSRKRKLQEKRN